MSNHPAIAAGGPMVQLAGVSKLYRLYQKPIYRFLDLFGLCPEDSRHFATHQALADIDLAIGRGEKVAVIGRNGAGKSTMLKIITGLVQPTTGSVHVAGRISNLLQLGSGFHPDFTGRQNVFAGLAHQGIIGAAAARLFDDIVEFSEIEEYIDQPMKTYSTGMCSRLMFASSVVMSPEILVVDEILGVGDAYFAHKSFERMRELCSNAGTTLLLVTHDIYSALNLCERFIWIDRGRIRFDGDGKGAIALYEASVKEQEEQSLRQKNAASLRTDGGDAIVHVIVRSRTGFALTKPLAIDEITIEDASGRSLPLTVADGDGRWHLMAESNLGDAEIVEGRRARSLRTYGSIYHKAEWSVQLPEGLQPDRVRIQWNYSGDDPVELRVVSTRQEVIIRGELPLARGWNETSFERAAKHQRESDLLKQVDYGTGAIRITAVEFLDRDGRSITQVRHGDSLKVRVHCHCVTPQPDAAVTYCVGFARQGSAYQLYIYDPQLTIPRTDRFVIDSLVDDVRLGSGVWYVNLGVGAPNMFKRTVLPYFSVDDAWYHLLSARLQIQVLSATQFDANGCFYWVPADITVAQDETGRVETLSATGAVES